MKNIIESISRSTSTDQYSKIDNWVKKYCKDTDNRKSPNIPVKIKNGYIVLTDDINISLLDDFEIPDYINFKGTDEYNINISTRADKLIINSKNININNIDIYSRFAKVIEFNGNINCKEIYIQRGTHKYPTEIKLNGNINAYILFNTNGVKNINVN